MILPFPVPGSSSHHGLIAHISGLFGVMVFLQQMLGHASVEHLLITTAGAGLSVYLTLAVGYATIRSVLLHGPSSEEEETDAEPPADETAADPTADVDSEAASEPTTA